ncbi:histidinol dehydrogenase [Sulfobacillus thermosulfidooxidans]|uniref:histidinol dehydrogenase n=1 Tax=Sulfobacillus thermosulfidooxidans TaxID=28034 RepID=UPI00096B8BBC|nr:histidinol dehydrogenase [Sulfobacillus thermosulfidooxidans]OLZ10551.1 histidinol dehydrogenase [Sulfobacillus thermosulfidooxidans]OLZ15239.1 histidinol dehydrogenase [Sulfobacillus thermosulfidooxidans]OLZ22228.1 histidinol dehydrogenase [Sulfobacillus thermosulfidooxidans]
MNSVQETVRQILDDIKQQGLSKALEYTEQFDGVRLEPDQVLVDVASLPDPSLNPDQKEAIDFAASQIRQFHQATKPSSTEVDPVPGLHLEERLVPLNRVGIYVPNGQYPLVSSLLMSAIPAQVAGVNDLIAAIAPRSPLESNPLWVYALKVTGIRTVLRLGGAQAIAIMGYGFDGFPPVDLIAGPGNQFVAQAKQELFRQSVVGIDVIAGPSEVLVITGEIDEKQAEVAALDLLAQAEHAPDAHAYFVSWNALAIKTVQNMVAQWTTDHQGILGQIDWITVDSPEEAVRFANQVAPEHLGLIGQDAESLAEGIKTAGALFVGWLAGQALGDYVAGPSHVLPTGGTGRFLGGLSTRTFMRRMSVIATDDDLPEAFLRAGQVLASLEGLKFHEQSLRTRLIRKASQGISQ